MRERLPGASDEDDKGKILACARCRRPITTSAARIELAGAGCGGQIGWLYRSAEHSFHGLILDSLIEVRE